MSYSSGSDDTDTCTEVYISDIIPNSVAARDGRLRQGDQILQVNGRDVSGKEDTETLIAENKNAVTFLVSRYLYIVSLLGTLSNFFLLNPIFHNHLNFRTMIFILHMTTMTMISHNRLIKIVCLRQKFVTTVSP